MPPRISAKSLLEDVEDGDTISTETVKRVKMPLFTHIHVHDLTVSVGSAPDKPDAQFVSADIFEGDVKDAFPISAARVPSVINSLLSYVKIAGRPVAIYGTDDHDCDADEDKSPMVFLVLHPNFDRKIYKEFAAHEKKICDRSQQILTDLQLRMGTVTGTVERIEVDIGAIRTMLEERVLPAIADR